MAPQDTPTPLQRSNCSSQTHGAKSGQELRPKDKEDKSVGSLASRVVERCVFWLLHLAEGTEARERDALPLRERERENNCDEESQMEEDREREKKETGWADIRRAVSGQRLLCTLSERVWSSERSSEKTKEIGDETGENRTDESACLSQVTVTVTGVNALLREMCETRLCLTADPVPVCAALHSAV
eukprot:CAMPEP_0182435026 /NCGR_PEP_ID=MMETSP1167-20130531/73127_1 /TAXON_ID=2988 /ORGANISM="Mallomonas Sp, Strain CCMP3275" /LENGTH=185 /DNA_ID=CAMNT_0024625561 /DNA_START=179 /DNA_END=735 /DNA_ORIENTATION=-